MKISLNWLKDFVDLPHDITPEQLGEDLTLHTVEVEEVIDQASQYDKMVVGQIQQIQDHPDADKLKICVTDIGEKHPAQIICGGQNIYEGMKVAVAMPGAKVRWHGEGELVELKKVKIRGVESQGMICAACEIGLTDENPIDQPYVMDLKLDDKAGTFLAKALSLADVVIDIDNKSITNRPDLWGHYGLAREISAIYGLTFQHQTELKTENENLKTKENYLSVEIKDKGLCRRFTALKIDNIKVTESPEWLKQRLQALGQKPINNLVDISNYVMFELGQPVHIFDVNKMTSNNKQITIIVRKANTGETIQTLDGEERQLDNSMLVVADEEKPIAIAGVMGGGNSEVDENTTSIIIEAANFEPINIRQTSQKLNLRSEASARFEKGLDPHLAKEANQRVAQLVMELNPEAKISSAFVDEGSWGADPTILEFGIDFINKRLGTELSVEIISDILERLGFKLTTDNLQPSASGLTMATRFSL